ncbi:hypothetical protein FGADI_3959 [Fusarium gaditjirri]|uniref:Mg2+ transporter zinc transport protein n=1 Tax=Fusarium gaditjirri TaxID=282569 RepID=A0A8H4TEV6_9HYPO|nr:hypothetical protein FGADI_3959 [Fusarium gaditjirri]
MQMSRHFPNERVGFCVDHRFVQEPYLVLDRAERLHSWAAESFLRTAIDPLLVPSSYWKEPTFDGYVLDRWPVFTRTRDDWGHVKIQYLVYRDTIYQAFDFDCTSDEGRKHPPTLLMKDGLLIRNLDFTDPGNRYNEASAKDEEYESRQEENCFIREHKFNCAEDGKDPKNRKSAVLRISCFQDYTLIPFVKQTEPDCGYYTIGRNELALETFETTGKLKIILGYKLDLVSQAKPSPADSTNALSTEAITQLASTDFRYHKLSGNPDLDPIFSRNLEHILSVCSIPVALKGSDEVSAIALTCGDIDGHRVVTAASFYSFQFLLLARNYFDPKNAPKGSCIKDMWDSIERVCKGHLRWLFQRGDEPSNLLSPHRWVNGESIEDNEYLPKRSLVDTPFQIIKAGDFDQASGGIEDSLKHCLKAGIKSTVAEWIRDIDQSNKLGLYAFPRCKKEKTHSFYFTDHVLIWRALKSAERLKLRDQLQNKIDVWKNIIDCQIAHGDDDDVWDEPLRFALAIVLAFYGKPINYRPVKEMRHHAMSVLLQSTSANGLFPGRLDENNEPALYQSEPMRDTYWSVTFEIPYLLWKFFCSAKKTPSNCSDGITEPMGVDGKTPAPPGTKVHISPPTGSAEQQPVVKMTANSRSDSMKHAFAFNNIVDQNNFVELTDEWLYSEPAFFVSSSKAVDDDNAGVDDDVHGDIDSQGDTFSGNAVKEKDFDPDIDLKTYLDAEAACDIYDDNLYSFEAISLFLRQMEDSTPPVSQPEFLGAMVDVPKSKHLKKNTVSLEKSIQKVTTRKSLEDQMEIGRTPEKAKKRFWGFFAENPSANEICLATSALSYSSSNSKQEGPEGGEDEELSLFYERHKSYDKFFTDDPVPVSNSWTTELHLSFYGVDKPKSSKSKESTMEATRKGSIRLPGSEEDDSTQLSRVVLSFRFDGDFFDRYWTCWFLEADPATKTTTNTIKGDVQALFEVGLRENKNVDLKKEPWRQRRVLELLLFDKIIIQMHSYANDILGKARSYIRKKTEVSGETTPKSRENGDEVGYDEFVKQTALFREFQEALQAVQDDLNENLMKVDQWLDREKDRQAERPRWTFNDESRYRNIISKLVVSNEHNIQELRRSHGNIRSFNALLTKKVDNMRNDVEQRRADDIQRFTYVTVVFLPLGFATGVFSMSEAPASRTLVYMIVVAIGALLTIYILLEDMKSIERIYKRISKLVQMVLDTTMRLLRSRPDFTTDKKGHPAKVWPAWMKVICQWFQRRVRMPDAEEGTAEAGTPLPEDAQRISSSSA